jgi:thymidylate synthase (FAD)
VRHIHLNYTQESQRYVKFKTSPDTDQYVIPESIQKKGGKVFEDFLDCLETIEAVYDNLISSGIPKEDCRMILPNACKTRLVVSGNFQAISDFCCLRNQIEAQWEIREIAREIFEIMAKEAPAYFEYFRGKDGYCKRKVWE